MQSAANPSLAAFPCKQGIQQGSRPFWVSFHGFGLPVNQTIRGACASFRALGSRNKTGNDSSFIRELAFPVNRPEHRSQDFY